MRPRGTVRPDVKHPEMGDGQNVSRDREGTQSRRQMIEVQGASCPSGAENTKRDPGSHRFRAWERITASQYTSHHHSRPRCEIHVEAVQSRLAIVGRQVGADWRQHKIIGSRPYAIPARCARTCRGGREGGEPRPNRVRANGRTACMGLKWRGRKGGTKEKICSQHDIMRTEQKGSKGG